MRRNTRTLVGSAITCLIAVALCTAPRAIEAQPTKAPRIGILSWWPPSPIIREDFRQAFREVGYVEGQNIIIEHSTASTFLAVEATTRSVNGIGRTAKRICASSGTRGLPWQQ